MSLLPERHDDLDPARGTVVAALLGSLLVSAAMWLAFFVAWPVMVALLGALVVANVVRWLWGQR